MPKYDMDYLDKFNALIEEYMPWRGEGDTKASQVATAVNKLIYKWWNDGDVFDNVHSGMDGWCNDLSSYANWLLENTTVAAKAILRSVAWCSTEDDYTELLCLLGDELLVGEKLENWAKEPKTGSIYDCAGPFRFREDGEEDEEEDEEEEEGAWHDQRESHLPAGEKGEKRMKEYIYYWYDHRVLRYNGDAEKVEKAIESKDFDAFMEIKKKYSGRADAAGKPLVYFPDDIHIWDTGEEDFVGELDINVRENFEKIDYAEYECG